MSTYDTVVHRSQTSADMASRMLPAILAALLLTVVTASLLVPLARSLLFEASSFTHPDPVAEQSP